MKLANATEKLQPEGAYAVLAQCEDLERQGKNIVHLEIGQPDFPTPKHISDAGVQAIQEGFTKYTPPLGIMPLREAIAEEISKTRGVDISPQQVAVTPSGKTAIFTAMSMVINPGDEVIYPNPCFPIYEVITDYLGGVKKPVPLLEKNGFSFDMEVFKKHFSKKTRLIILNSPSNPTGGVMPRAQLEEIAEMVKGTDCWIMTDEMYSRITYDDIEYPSFYALSELHDRTILVDGLSKTYSMTGWRIGYLSAPLEIMKKVDYFLTHTVACTASFTQKAAIEAYKGPPDEVTRMVTEFARRREYIVDALNNIKGVTCQKPQGAFYVFPNISSFGKTSKQVAEYLLKDAGVALLDGTAFGSYGEGYLRISYATAMEKLEEGVRRIQEALGKM